MSPHDPALIRLRLTSQLDRVDSLVALAAARRSPLREVREAFDRARDVLRDELDGRTLLQLPDGTIVVDGDYPGSLRCHHVHRPGEGRYATYCHADVLQHRIDDDHGDPADLPPVAWYWLSIDDYHRVAQRRCPAHFDASLPVSFPDHWTLVWRPEF